MEKVQLVSCVDDLSNDHESSCYDQAGDLDRDQDGCDDDEDDYGD